MGRAWRYGLAAVAAVAVVVALYWAGGRHDPRLDRELGLAVQRKDAAAVARLLEAGARPDARTGACDEPNPDLIERLTGLTTAVREQLPLPVLHWAASVGDRESVRCLLKHGANVNERDAMFTPPLLRAIWAGCPDIAGDLIGAGADPNAQVTTPVHQTTPLIAAIAEVGVPSAGLPGVEAGYGPQDAGERRRLSMALVQLLIGSGANVNLPDPYGRTPLQVATGEKRTDLLKLLRAAGAR